MIKLVAWLLASTATAVCAQAADSQREWNVMGTYLNVTIYDDEHPNILSTNLDTAFAVVSEIDRDMSNYRPDSELSRLNQSAGAGPIHLRPSLYALLETAEFYRILSGGAFDITAGSLVALWGFYDPQNARIPSNSDIAAILPNIGEGRLNFDSAIARYS